MVSDVPTTAITFREARDLHRMKTGVYAEELGQRIVYVSPAIWSLLQGPEKASVLEGLMVATDKGTRWIMDLMGDRE